ncbi:MAG: iron uptake porin, partial [Bacteroidota bacterium]
MEKRKSCLCLALALVGILPAGPIWAFTPTSELTDVSPDHWAYNSIKTLVDRYQVMEGFNDNTFRGAKYVTRYEQAAVLAKVMAKVEEMIASATGTAPAPIIPPSINPEDLRTIARLQQEFRDELTILRGRVDTMDQRLGVLENRVRLHGELGLLSRSFTSPVRGRDNVRVETSLGLDARMAPDLSYSGLLTLFNNGMQFQRNGHLWEEAGARGETTRGDSGSPFYLQRSTFTWTPGNWSLSGGVFRFEDTLPVGSFIKTGFSTLPLWAEGQSGYGFVGTPALNQGYALFKYPNTNRAAWLPGINPAQDLLDPNSSPVNRPGASPALAVRSDWGPLEWGLGVSSGVPGSDLTLAMADVPNSFP